MRADRLRALAAALLLLAAGGASAAENLAVVTPEQFRAALAAERGQAVVVNLWASWCSPCLREIPELLRLERDYARCGVRLVGITMDEPDTLESVVRPLLTSRFPDFRSLARDGSSMDAFASVIDGAWNELMPTSYVLDRDGRMVSRIQGGKSYGEFEALVKPLARCP